MSKYKTAVIVLAVVVVLQIFALGYLILQNRNLKEAVADAESLPEFKHISENGYFVVYKGGVARDFSGQRNIKLEWYTDGLCPDCTRAHSRAEDYIYEKINNGSMEVKYHPLNFLPQYSPEDYPLRTAVWTLGVAEYAPEQIQPFMTLLYREDNDVPLADRNDAYLVDMARQAGVSDTAIAEVEDNWFVLEAIVNKASVGIRQNKSLIEISPLERVFVPFIFVDGHQALMGESEDTDKDIIEPIQKIIDDSKFTPCGDDDGPGCD